MKFFRFILMFALVLSVPVLSRAEVVDGIMAVVADKVVTFAQVEDYTAPVRDTLARQYAGQPDVLQNKYQAALHDGLEQLVERALILHNYETAGYNKLPDSVVDKIIEDKIRERFGDRVTMIKTLQAQGITLEQFRKNILDTYIEGGLRNLNVKKDVIISPSKIEDYYKAHPEAFKVEDQVKLRMIILAKTSPDDTNTFALAREIDGKIKAGTPFSEMVNIYSQSSPQHQSGDWGWVERSVLRKELGDVAFTLNKGQVSDPIDTPDSVYIMLVEDKNPTHIKPLPDVRDSIETTLSLQEQDRLAKEWIDGLKKKTYVVLF